MTMKNRKSAKSCICAASLIISVLCAGLLAGCRKKTEQEKKLVVYSPHPVEFITELVRNFENDTGIHVEAVQKGTGEILSSLALDLDSPACDVMWGGSLSSVASAENLFEPYTTPNEEFFQSAYKNTEGVFTRFSDVPSGLVRYPLSAFRKNIRRCPLHSARKSRYIFANRSPCRKPQLAPVCWQHTSQKSRQQFYAVPPCS